MVDLPAFLRAQYPRSGTGMFAFLQCFARATSDIPIDAATVFIG
jgi:hypothetical protein